MGADKLTAEVEQANQLPAILPAAQGKNAAVSAVLHPHVGVGVEAGLLRPDSRQPAQSRKDPALTRIRAVPALRHIPAEIPAVDIAAVVPLLGVVVITVVVELAYLVAAVDHGDAALREHPCVERQVAGDGALKLEGVSLKHRGLHAAQ